MLAKAPAFTAVAVLTLALGIGANTAIFSAVDAELLRSLPIRDPQRLVVFKWTARRNPKLRGSNSFQSCPGDEPAHGCVFSYPMYRQFRKLNAVFSDVAAIGATTQFTLTGNGAAKNVGGELVSGNFFRTLGVHAMLGRTLDPSGNLPASAPVAVLSYGFWQGEFGGQTSAVGKTILLNQVPVTIVGVIARKFPGLSPGSAHDLWLPLSLERQLRIEWFGESSGKKPSLRAGDDVWWVYVLARLKPAESIAQAQTAADVSFRDRVLHGSKTLFRPKDAPALALMPAPEGVVGDRAGLYRPLMILMFAVGIILLVACANVAGLIVARAVARQNEMAIRLALGARCTQIFHQLLTESVLLSLSGGALGILLAYWSSRALGSFIAPVHLDWRVLAFTAAISLAAGIVFGLAPAVRGTRVSLVPALKEGAGATRTGVGHAGRGWLNVGNGLVVAQVALSVVALAGAGLLVRTLKNLEGIRPGFDTQNLLLFGIDPRLQGYSNAQCQSLYMELQRRLSELPGVASATYSYDTLLAGDLWRTSFQVVGGARKQRGLTDGLAVGPKFAETMGIPLLAGRTFAASDFAPSLSPRPVMVNQSFAREFFGHADPVGGMLAGFDTCDPDCEIVGVVGDARYQTLRRTIHPTVYVPQEAGSTHFEVRTAGNPRALVPAVRGVVGQIDGNLPVYGIRTQRQMVRIWLSQPRRIARLSGFFAVLALLLACIGLCGLLSFEVSRRTREIGIRMALGAQRRDVLRLVVGQGIVLALVGTGIGIATSLGMTRYLGSLLYGVSATDPWTFAGVAVLLTVVALVACYIPARKATRTDPTASLRNE